MADSYENTKMPDRPEEELQPDIIPVDDKGQPLPDPSEFLGSYIKPRSLDELQKAYGAAEEDETIKDTMEPVQPTSFFRKHRPGRRGYDYYGTPAGSIPNDSNGLSESPLSKHFTAAEAIDPEFTEDENGEEIPFIPEEPQINMGKVVTPEQKPFETAEEENDGYNKLLDSKKEIFSKPEVKKDKDAPRIMDLYKDSMNTKVIYQAGQDDESSLGSLSREEATELFAQPQKQTKFSSRKLKREERRALREKRKLEKKKEKERRKAEKAAEKARKKAEKNAKRGKAAVQDALTDQNEKDKASAIEAKKAEEIRKAKEAEEKRIKAQEEQRRKQEEEKRIQQLRLEAKKTVEEAKKQLEREKAELLRSQQEKMKEQESRSTEALRQLEEEKSAAQKAAQEAKQAREEAERMKAELEKMKLQAENALRQKTAAEEAAKAERQERERLESEAKRREEAERRREEFERRRVEENRKRAEAQHRESERLKQQKDQAVNSTIRTNGNQPQNINRQNGSNQQNRQNNNNHQKHKNNQNYGGKNFNHNNSNANPPARKTNTETTEDIKRRLAEMTSRLDTQQEEKANRYS